MGTAAAVVGAVTGAVGTIAQIGASGRAQRQQEKAEKLRERQAQLAAQRQRVKAVREARIRRGQLEAGAVATGTGGSSGVAGGQAAITTGLASNIAFSQQQEGLASQVGQANISAAQAQSQAATFGAIGGVGQSIFQQAGGFQTIFNSGGGGTGGGTMQTGGGFTVNLPG